MDGPECQVATSLQHALVMAALADGRSRLAGSREDPDTGLLIDSLLALGVVAIADSGTERIDVAGTGGYWPNSDAELHAGDCFHLACLMTAACCLGRGQYTVLYDPPEVSDRQLIPLLSALVDLRAGLEHQLTRGRMAVNIGPDILRGGAARLPVGCPPAVLESLLIVGPYAVSDVMIETRGATTHAVEHLLPLMETFGVSVLEESGRFIIPAPQRYRGQELIDLGR